jgi:hypothetical protein
MLGMEREHPSTPCAATCMRPGSWSGGAPNPFAPIRRDPPRERPESCDGIILLQFGIDARLARNYGRDTIDEYRRFYQQRREGAGSGGVAIRAHRGKKEGITRFLQFKSPAPNHARQPSTRCLPAESADSTTIALCVFLESTRKPGVPTTTTNRAVLLEPLCRTRLCMLVVTTAGCQGFAENCSYRILKASEPISLIEQEGTAMPLRPRLLRWRGDHGCRWFQSALGAAGRKSCSEANSQSVSPPTSGPLGSETASYPACQPGTAHDSADSTAPPAASSLFAKMQ